MSGVKNTLGFIHWLVPDLSIKILSHLDDPRDLAYVSSVSNSWHQFVIENGLFKKLCLKKFPEISSVTHIIEVDNMIEPVSNLAGNFTNWECLKRNHKVYAFLAAGFTPSIDKEFFKLPYWKNGRGRVRSNPNKVVYKLHSKVFLVTEIHISPHTVHLPIYSSIRIRMGHLRYPLEQRNTKNYLEADQFIWMYTSPEFPMSQKNRVKKFKLPEPVLCIEGMVQVELFGSVQKHEMDELFYINISQVKVVGRSLSPTFDIKLHHPSGKCTLNYCHEIDNCLSPTSSCASVLRITRYYRRGRLYVTNYIYLQHSRNGNTIAHDQ